MAGNSPRAASSPAPPCPPRKTDFLGVTTAYTWDPGRQLKLSQTRAANRPEAQTTATQWHTTLRLPVHIDEAGRSTAYTYDSAGNLLTETVTDTATGEARTRRWSYNPQGLAASLTDARGGVWTYAYDAQGNRISERNPLGQETRREFDAAARVTKETAPNGLVTTYAYDTRGRLLSLSTGGEVSTYAYTPSGQIAGATLPGGRAIAYQYDAAQRLIGTSDNGGNRIAYTLDAMGNRTVEEVRDAGDNLALSSARVINRLNQLAATQGALGQTTRYTYDANGERISATDPLNQATAQSLDALRRPVATTFADNAQARQSWTALNDLASVTDPKGVVTTYTRNAFGEVTAETSPDSGSIRHQFDAAGNVTARTDALSQTTRYEYDLANRLIRILQADGKEQVFSYDASQPNTPSSVVDPSGATTWQRDALGRITAKAQSVNDNPANPTTLRVAYGWSAGQLGQISYPSGLNLFYRRNAAGQISGIDVQEPGRNKPIAAFVTDLSHTALGQPKAWRWASGDTAQRSFDADGRMVASEIASYQFDAAGRISAVTQSLHASQTQTVATTGSGTGTATAVTTTRFTTPITWTASYDPRNRLTAFTRAGAASAYTWDANGNRLTSLDTTRADTDLDGAFDAEDFSTTTAQSLAIAEGSNRLLGFTQTLSRTQGTRTLSSTSAQVAYSLDGAGNLTSDGLRSFGHDANGRLAQVRLGLGSEEAATVYLHNALGQRVFKSEPQATQYAPDEEELGSDFIAWLKKNFGWLFARAQANATLGQSFVYADAPLPEWALLGEYGNGGSKSAGRLEVLWLPTEDGGALPIGLYRNGRFYAIHPDYLGTPRLITNDANEPVWQWPYSAFGANKPTGILKATQKPKQAYTNEPMLLKGTNPAISFNLRFPGQYFDEESNLNYNYFRNYMPTQGRYSQADPIGLDGGLNRFGYGEGNALSNLDPRGLDNPGMGPYGSGPNNYGRGASSHWQRSAALADFIRNFNNMRDANTKKSDHYFHCKANCEATRRGRFGEALACELSDWRELWDQYGYKWDSARDSRADQAANALGRSGALSSSKPCSAVCGMFRPNGLPANY
jgi:RHS repeat-associated protein